VHFETTLERLRAILGPCERGKRGGWDVAVTGKGTFRNVADVENAAANVSRTSPARMVELRRKGLGWELTLEGRQLTK
jgi:hypothetical protein